MYLIVFYFILYFIFNSDTVRRYWAPVERRHSKYVIIWYDMILAVITTSAKEVMFASAGAELLRIFM